MRPLHACLLLWVSCLAYVRGGDTSLYDYFTSGGISEGLTAKEQVFKLNGKEFKILSGSLHYFRYK